MNCGCGQNTQRTHVIVVVLVVVVQVAVVVVVPSVTRTDLTTRPVVVVCTEVRHRNLSGKTAKVLTEKSLQYHILCNTHSSILI